MSGNLCNTLFRGAFFGEASTLFKLANTATVRAATNVKVFSVSSQNFLSILKSFHVTNNSLDVGAILDTLINKLATMAFSPEVNIFVNEVRERISKEGSVKVLLLKEETETSRRSSEAETAKAP